MKKFTKDIHTINGNLAQIQSSLGQLAKSDEWGSRRSCAGCLVTTIGFLGSGVTLTWFQSNYLAITLTSLLTVVGLVAS